MRDLLPPFPSDPSTVIFPAVSGQGKAKGAAMVLVLCWYINIGHIIGVGRSVPTHWKGAACSYIDRGEEAPAVAYKILSIARDTMVTGDKRKKELRERR